MFRWAPFPYVRISIVAIAGILFYQQLELEATWLWTSLIILSVTYLLLFILIKNNEHFHFRHLFGLVGLLTLFFVFQIRSSLSDPGNQPGHLIHHTKSSTFIFGKITGEGEETDKNYRYQFAVSSVKDSSQWHKVKGKIHLYISKQAHQKFEPGDQLIISGQPTPVAPPLNPGQFDYRNYLARQQIHHQMFVRENRLVKTGNQLFFLYQWANDIKTYAITQFAKIKDPAARGVIQGLVLGSKDNIDEETKNAYKAAGLMHILAVSGLHVGIIYGILIVLFGHLRKYQAGKIYFAIVCVTVLWFYALVTGLSPSVVRASVMFTIFAMAETTRKQKNSYNILAASAFLMLMINPDLLFTVSFQLSYLAVLGIIYLQPIFEKLWHAPNILLKRIWQLFTVGLAAQIATLPITIYYFHQVPLLSTIVGIVAVPLATGSFTLALIYLALAQVPWLNEVLLWLLENCVKTINWLAINIEALNFSLLENIYFNQIQTVTLYLILVSFLVFLYYRSFKHLLTFFILLFFFNTFTIYNNYKTGNQRTLVIFSVPGKQVGQINLNGKGFWLNPKLPKEEKDIAFHASAYNLKHKIKRQPDLPIANFQQTDYYSIYLVENKKILLLQKLPQEDFTRPIEVDYLVVGYNAVSSLRQLESHFLAKEIILDSSNADWLVKQLAKEAKRRRIKLHPVTINGARVIEL